MTTMNVASVSHSLPALLKVLHCVTSHDVIIALLLCDQQQSPDIL
jgi:hypothetical protein